MAARSRTTVFILGNILFGALGLVIGYFLLVQMRPDMNFLGLNIPQLKEMEVPAVPEGWPSVDWDPTKPYAAPSVVAPPEAGADGGDAGV